MNFFRNILCVFVLHLVNIGFLTASEYRFEMWMEGIRQQSESDFVFDIFLKNTGADEFVIESYGFGVSYNRVLLNGGAFNPSFLTYLEGSSCFEPGDDRPNYPLSLGFTESEAGSGLLLYQARPALPHAFLTPLGPGEELKIGSFRVQLRDTWELNSQAHPLGCVFPELMLTEDLCHVVASASHSGAPNYQAYQVGGIEIPEKNIRQPESQQAFSGYWFYGSGSWDDASAWNIQLLAEHPEYNQTLPCSTANVVVTGQLIIPRGTHTDLTHNTPHSGHISLIQIPKETYSITLVANGENIIVSIYDETFQDLGVSVSNVSPGTNFSLFTLNVSPFDTFYNWTDQFGEIICETEFCGYFIMPAHDVVLTANWASGQDPGPMKASKENPTQPSIIIEPGASLRINTLQADMPEKDISPLVYIQSDASGSGELIHDGPAITALVERYMPGNEQTWHLLAAPVGNLEISASNFSPGSEDDFYLWGEFGDWINFKEQESIQMSPGFVTHNEGTTFSPGKGYLVAYKNINQQKSFTGTLNAGTYTATLTKSAGKNWTYEAGWNLLGNPYASSVDFTAIDVAGILSEYHAHVYNPNKSGGEGYESVSVIAPGQGFFVHAAHHGAEFVFSRASQTHGGSFLKSQPQAAPDKIQLRISQWPYFDELTIALNEASDFAHNPYNASKLYSFLRDVPQIAGITSDYKATSVMHIPGIRNNMCIPLLTRIATTDTIRFSVEKKTGSFVNWNAMLHDALNNTYHAVGGTKSYATSGFAGEQTGRHSLCLSVTALSAPVQVQASQARLYSDGRYVFVENPYTQALVSLYAPCGTLIKQRKLSKGTKRLRPANHRGPLIVEFISGQTRISSTALLF